MFHTHTGPAASDRCFVCECPTDSGVTIVGDSDWFDSIVAALGAPVEGRRFTTTGEERKAVLTITIFLCAFCAARSTFPTVVPALMIPGSNLPVLVQ